MDENTAISKTSYFFAPFDMLINALESFTLLIWVLAVPVQLYFWIAVAWPLSGRKEAERGVREPVSIVICAHRMTSELPALVEAILQQQYPVFEVILVNDGPREELAAFAKTIEDTRFRHLPYDEGAKRTPGKKQPLAHGIANARYDWLLMTDADCAIRPGWISAMMGQVSPRHRVVIGYAPLTGGKTLAARISSFDSVIIAMQYLGFAVIQHPYMAVGRNLMYHRSVFDTVGGFTSHSHVISGDDDLFIQEASKEVKVAVSIDHRAIVTSIPETSWADLVAQKQRHLSTSTHYTRRAKLTAGSLGASFGVFWLLAPFAIQTMEVIPLAIFIVVLSAQWLVFTALSGIFECKRYRLVYPLWAVVYSVFLVCLAAIKLRGGQKDTWNA